MTAVRGICGVAFLLAVGWADQAQAQFGAGTVWVRTDGQAKGIVLTVSACCSGTPAQLGHPGHGQPAGDDDDRGFADGRHGGADPGGRQAIGPDDGRHAGGRQPLPRGREDERQPFGTSNGTVAADGRTMTVESAFEGGGATQKTTETWVRK